MYSAVTRILFTGGPVSPDHLDLFGKYIVKMQIAIDEAHETAVKYKVRQVRLTDCALALPGMVL